MRYNYKPKKTEQEKLRCFCTGEGLRKEKRQCHLCKSKTEPLNELAGHVYCEPCLNQPKG